MKKYHIFLLVSAIFISACSGLKLVYNQLDWVAPAYVDQYVNLSDVQYRLVETKIEDLLAWHCKHALLGYSDWLAEVAVDVKKDKITNNRLIEHREQLTVFWQQIMAQTTPKVIDLLVSFDDEQIDVIKEKFNDENKDLKEKFIDPGREEVKDLLVERMEDRIEKWVDDLTDQQKNIIQNWGNETTGKQYLWMDNRKRWQTVFVNLMQNSRDDVAEFNTVMTDLILYPNNYWTHEYRDFAQSYRENLDQLLVQLASTITEQQKGYFVGRLLDYSSDFRDLSCIANKAVT